MIRYLIIEDELLAYEELKRMMDRLRPDFQMAGWAQSVAQSVTLLKSQSFDLILADITLADGSCFEIFEHTDISIPVIFTTAYDEYAIKAFKVNGIDYLLKPIEQSELEGAILRFERESIKIGSRQQMAQLQTMYTTVPKTRFIVRCGDSLLPVYTDDIAFFYSEDKYTYLQLFSGKSHIIDYTLDNLESTLDNSRFFRTSRNCIVNISSVTRCSKLFGGRLKLYCKPELPVEASVSRSRVKNFIDWIEGTI